MSEMALLKYAILFIAGVGTATIGCSLIAQKQIGMVAKLFLVGMAAVFAVGAYSYLIEPNWIEVTKVRIKDEKLAQAVGHLKIVHMTDIHLTEGLGFREKQLIKRVNDLKPDLILFTGDIIDDLTQIPSAIELFKSLRSRIGIYGIPGDTDHIVIDGHSLARELAPGGIDILVNEARKIWIDDAFSFWLVGLDDANTPASEVDRALLSVPEQMPHIVMAPGPDIFETVSESGSNLLLVGDTHGGQIGIPLLIHLSDYANRTPYMKGLFRRNNTQMYVNRGIGTKTLPIRFLCRPEIAVIEIRK